MALCLPCAHGPSRAWPVARSIFDAPYVREANEGTTCWIRLCRLYKFVAWFLLALLVSPRSEKGEATREARGAQQQIRRENGGRKGVRGSSVHNGPFSSPKVWYQNFSMIFDGRCACRALRLKCVSIERTGQ